MLWTKVLVVAIAGALGAAYSNRGIAVFHDGIRGVMPELAEGRIRRAELASIAFGMCFLLLLGFGLPFSMISTVLLTHVLWLGTDMIGTWFSENAIASRKSDATNLLSLLGVSLLGGLYGGALTIGLEVFARSMQSLPIQFLDSAGQFGGPIVFTFAAFPAVAIGYQRGVRHGLVAFLITLVGRQIAAGLGQAQPDAWALAIGMVVLFVYAVREKNEEDEGVAALAGGRAGRIRSNLPAIALLGAVYGIACNLGIMMEGAQSAIVLGQGDRVTAVAVTLARAFSFAPLKVMSALSTGVFAMDGLGFVASAGLVAPNWVAAAFAGACVMSGEALCLGLAARLLDRFPGFLKAADNIRTAMTRLLELATLVGGMMAANRIAPGMGLLVV
ncbi:MAG: YhfT family protein, partial [Chloroflexi bacterium]|nr:YhfT family protein [Chloroflexota bacterium]